MPYAVDPASFDPRLMHHPPPVSVATDPFYSASGSVYASCDTAGSARSGKRKREPHDEAADGDNQQTGQQQQQDWAASYSSPTGYPDSFAISGKNPYSSASDSYSYPMEAAADSGWSAGIAAYGAPFSQSGSGQILPHHHSHQDDAAPPPYLHPDGLYDGSGLPPMSSFRSSQFTGSEPHHSSSMSKALYPAPDHAASGYPAASTPVSSPSNWTRLPPTSGSFTGPTAAEPVSVHQNLHPIVSADRELPHALISHARFAFLFPFLL